MSTKQFSPHLFVFDVDGTLLDSQMEVLPSTRLSIGELLGKSHHVALASARPPRSVAALSKQLLSNETEIISLNGAFITRGSEILPESSISPSSAIHLIEEARKRDLQINLLSSWEWLIEDYTSAVAMEAKIVGFEPTTTMDLTTEVDNSVHKMLFLGEPGEVRAFRDWIRSGLLGLEAALSKPTYCEVVAEGVSKAGAVRFLAEALGVPFAQTVAFGDGENDLPMITSAGTGVAMGNAMETVKRAATLVTESNDEDGIARALVQLGFIENKSYGLGV